MTDNAVPGWLEMTGEVAGIVGTIATAAGVIVALWVVIRDNHRYRDQAAALRANQARLILSKWSERWFPTWPISPFW